jgi:hypothetical protein
VIDPGDVVTTTVTLTNNPTSPTPIADDINVSPISFDDAYNVLGNIAFTFDAASGIPQGPTVSADAEFFINTSGPTRRRRLTLSPQASMSGAHAVVPFW